MSEKDKHINHDDFSQKIKEKLENHSMPVDENIWLEIEKKLVLPKQKKPIPFRYWLSGAVAAAAVLALLLIVKPFESTDIKDFASSKTTVPSVQELVSTEETSVEKQQVETDLREIFMGEGQKKGRTPIVGVQKPLRPGLTFWKKEVSRKPEIAKAEIRETPTTTIDAFSQTIVESKEESTSVKQEVSGKEQETHKNIDVLPDLNDYPEVAIPSKTRKKRPLLLAMSVETSNGLNVQNANDFDFIQASPCARVASNNKVLVNEAMAAKYNSVLNVSDFTKARHLPPLSVGLTVALPFTERFAVESGLVYTYLKSEFTRPGITHYKANLHLHYLGIPLNLRVKLWNKPAWNIYISAGGMVEKGLRSIYNQEIDGGDAVLDTDIKSKIDGLQWSVNSGLGIDVKLQKHLSLFAEPKLIYYMENNQPESARSESPLYIGVNGGLRIEL